MNKRYHLACDLGSKSIKAAVGCYDPSRNTVKILDAAYANSSGIEKGLIADPEAASGTVIDLVYQLGLSKSDLGRISFNLSGAGLLSQNLTGELRFPQPAQVTYGILDRLDKVIADSAPIAGKSVMFVTNKKYFIDGEFVFEPLGERCMRFQGENFLVYSDDRQKNALTRLVDLLGLKTIDIFPEGMLSAESCIKQDERDLGAVLADVGYEKTDIAVFADGNIQLCYVLPVGIRDIVNTVSYIYEVPFEDALYIYENYSNLLMKGASEKKPLSSGPEGSGRWLDTGEYNRLLEDLCRQLAERIAEIVERHGYGDAVFSGYVISGGLAKIRGLAASLAPAVPHGFKVKTGRSYGFTGMDYITEDPRWYAVLGALKIMASDYAEEKIAEVTPAKKIIGFFSRLFPKKQSEI